MTNPTGAENAQVQDGADRKAQDELRRAIANLFRKFVIDDDMLYKVDEALREAEQRGLMRAAEVIENPPGGMIMIPDALDVIPYARGYAHGKKDAREAIERAATPEAEG